MGLTWNDGTRTALITFVQAVFPVLVFTGVVSMTDQEIAATVVAINAGVTFAALIFKQGQGAVTETTKTTETTVVEVEEVKPEVKSEE